MDKKYLGFRKDRNQWEKFSLSNPEDATPENSGYEEVIEDDGSLDDK